MGRSTTSAARSSRSWPSAASTSTNWRKRRTSPTPTRSTCSATGLQRPASHPPRTGRAPARASEATSSSSSPRGRAILDELLEKYTEHGTAQFVLPDVLQVPPISTHGNVIEIAGLFGGADQLRDAVQRTADAALRRVKK